jgi:hypothetical protein
MTGNAVVYALHMVALGLLARLEVGSWRAFALTTAGILVLLFYSLSCDPLWSVVHGAGWAASFAVVALGRLHVRTILVRCVALGCCVVFLFLGGTAEYVRTLTRYTARIQFPGSADRVAAPDLLASQLFYSPYMRYFYLFWALGWLLGILTLTGRARLLVVTGMGSGLYLAGYTVLYLLLNAAWLAPLPVYLEQGLFPLFTISAVAGYSGVLSIAAVSARRAAAGVARRASDGRWPIGSVVPSWPRAPWRIQGDRTPAHSRRPLLMAGTAAIAVAIIPAAVVGFAIERGPTYAEQFHERWPDEPELAQFLEDRIGLGGDRPFRGSAHFWPHDYGIGLTVSGLWARGVPTVVQYSQLVTPPSYYFAHAVSQEPAGANVFNVFPGPSWENYWKALQVLGARYHVTAQRALSPLSRATFPVGTFPYRPLTSPNGLWYVYEMPHPNIGNYSPTEVTIARSGAEIVAVMVEPHFDFSRRAVVSAPIDQPLVVAGEMRMSPIRGGLHVSGHSAGSSLVVLPQQFSHCLRARDVRVRLVRVDLVLTGMVFSGDVDTDIVFDYGILTPRCRTADLADLRQLDLRIRMPMIRATGDALFPGWKSALATLAAAAGAVK